MGKQAERTRGLVEGELVPAVASTSSEPTENLPDVVGLLEREAAASLEAAGFTVRSAAQGGEDFILTQDYQTNRVTLVVDCGVVTNVEIG